MGWFGEPKAKSVKDLVDIVSDNYDKYFIEAVSFEDHFWILHKSKEYTTATCYLVNNDGEEYSYKPIPIEEGPRFYDVPKSWLDKITDVEERKNGIYNLHLKQWLNSVRMKNKIDIKPYDFKELNSESIYTGKINQMKHLIATDPHYGKDVWCRYEKKFNEVNDWTTKLIIKNMDYFDTYKEHALNMSGVDFSLLLRNDSFKNIDKLLDIDSKSTSYSRIFNRKETEVGMDTAQVALGVNEKAKEISDYYKDYDNDSLDLDGYRPYFSIETLTDGIFGTVTEYSFDNKVAGIVITGWIDADADYDEQRLLNYLTERFEIKDIKKVVAEENIKEEIDGLNSI